MDTITETINRFIGLIKNNGLELFQEDFKNLDKLVQDFILKWLTDNDWIPQVPFEHLGLDTCITAWIEKKTKVYVFSLYYEGSDTGTGPCGGNLIFSFDGAQVTLLLDNVKCGE